MLIIVLKIFQHCASAREFCFPELNLEPGDGSNYGNFNISTFTKYSNIYQKLVRTQILLDAWIFTIRCMHQDMIIP